MRSNMHSHRWFVFAVVTVVGCSAGGTSSDSNSTAARICDPGASRPCACSDGRSGAQACSDDGAAYDTCECVCAPTCAGKQCGNDGCGGTCGSCAAGLACSGTSKCELDPLGAWEVTIVDGSVIDKDYNYTSLPDPKFCMQLDGAFQCTSYALDTTAPTWNTKLGTTTAANLLKPFTWELLDDDSPTDPDDTICSGTHTFSMSELQSGGFTISCKDGSGLVIATVRATVKPIAR
ncbi:MAG: hypothetical protein ACXWUG_10550 [Polyangiales bacterium]